MVHKKYLNNYFIDKKIDLYQSINKWVSFDFETTGLEVYNGAVAFTIAFYDEKGKTTIHDFDRGFSRKKWEKVQDIFNDVSIGKIAHNLKFELSFLHLHDIKIPENTVLHDSMLMHQILRNDFKKNTLSNLSWEYMKFDKHYDSYISKLAEKEGNRYDKVDRKIMHEYQHNDVERCFLLGKVFYKELRKDSDLLKCYINEINYLHTAQKMERTGLHVSTLEINKLLEWLNVEQHTIKQQIKRLHGRYYNLSSSDVLRYLLFDELKLIPFKKTKTGLNATDKEIILHFRKLKILENSINPEKYEVLNLILKTKSYKMGVTNLTKYKRMLDKNNMIHPNILTNNTATGRQACRNPNLQNVQKGETATVPYPVLARSIFTTEKDYYYLLGDYAGIEMRLIIEVSQDEKMLDCLLHGNGDIHSLASAILLGKTFTDEKDKKKKKMLRSKGKNINFAIPYGANINRIAVMLNMSEKKAIEKMKLYSENFPKVYNFSKSMINAVMKNNCVVTSFGRKLWVNKETAYMGSNYVIQGTAAEILKRASVKVGLYCQQYYKDLIIPIMPIHDELIFRVHKSLLEKENKIRKDISKIMTTFKEIKVPLEVEYKRTFTNWYEAKEI